MSNHTTIISEKPGSLIESTKVSSLGYHVSHIQKATIDSLGCVIETKDLTTPFCSNSQMIISDNKGNTVLKYGKSKHFVFVTREISLFEGSTRSFDIDLTLK